MFDNQPIQAPRITPEVIKNLPIIKCDECGSQLFTEKLTFRKMSALISPTGKEEMVPIPLFVCDKCGKISDVHDPYGLAPEELKARKIAFTGMRIEK
jgi:hypothetical protein